MAKGVCDRHPSITSKTIITLQSDKPLRPKKFTISPIHCSPQLLFFSQCPFVNERARIDSDVYNTIFYQKQQHVSETNTNTNSKQPHRSSSLTDTLLHYPANIISC